MPVSVYASLFLASVGWYNVRASSSCARCLPSTRILVDSAFVCLLGSVILLFYTPVISKERATRETMAMSLGLTVFVISVKRSELAAICLAPLISVIATNPPAPALRGVRRAGDAGEKCQGTS